MRYEQDSLSYINNRVPTLLTVDHTILAKHQIWIGKHARRGFKIDAACFFWFDRFFLASHSKRMPLYITYNTFVRETASARIPPPEAVVLDG